MNAAAAYRPLLATLMRDRAASHLLLRLTGFIALCIVGKPRLIQIALRP